MVREIDRKRKDLEARIKRPSGFIIPGGNPVAAHIDLARAVARRCERKVAGLVLAACRAQSASSRLDEPPFQLPLVAGKTRGREVAGFECRRV